MAGNIIDNIEANPVIAAIRNEEDIEIAIKSEVSSVFLLKVDIFNVDGYVRKIKNSGKHVFVHFEFLELAKTQLQSHLSFLNILLFCSHLNKSHESLKVNSGRFL